MAITNAQQYQQLVNKPANGKRPGYRGPGGYQGGASSRGGPPGGGATAGGSGRDFSGGGGGGGRQDRDSQYTGGGYDSSKNVSRRTTTTSGKGGGSGYTGTTTVPIKKPKKTKDNSTKSNVVTNYLENSLLSKGLQAAKNSKFVASLNARQREAYLENLKEEDNELYQQTVDDLAKLGYATRDVELYGPESKGAGRDIEIFTDLGEDQAKSILNTVVDNNEGGVGTLYDDYLDSRNTATVVGSEQDQVIDPCKGPNPPAYCFVDKEEEEVINPRDYTGLAPRFMGSIFDFTNLAEGGRVAAQQGGIMSQQGGIMPRLNDLSGDVSSAEQMLQEINQRLESAESTLGEGGGDPSSGLIAIQPNNFNNFQPRQMPIGNPLTPAPRYSSFEEMMKNRIQSDIPRSFINLEGVRSNPDGTPYTPPDNNQILSLMTNQTPSPQANVPLGPLQPAIQPGIQSPIAGAIRQGAMDGGRMRQMEMMQDEDDPTGGIMDLESGRQMYFLGKLVKKAGRAIKKVAKSPIGKAALLYFGGNALMGAGGGKGLGSFFGKGSFNPLRMAAKATSNGPMTQLSPFGKILSKLGMATGEEGGKLTLGGNIGLGIGLPFALDMLGVGKDDDKKMDLDEYYKTQGIDIDAIRNNPNRILARRFMAEGGDAEPVAKKTMPLLDMDGMEKDYREEGGFVPIGRMERADDVPARLSKNEFVFTADAVRNAGEGDIDKGAEVMYNMMKNLESGGEVSEESQGLDGAREMFQTSKRLEEVL
jgi:hypothetical protein